jgi:hypothetical protein
MSSTYRYRFDPTVAEDDIHVAMVLATFAAECLHGESQVKLDAAYLFDGATCVIDAATLVGEDLNRLFVGFLRRELEPEQFSVERLPIRPVPTPLPSAN